MATQAINVTTDGSQINASIGICAGPGGVFFSLPASDPDTMLRMLEYARIEVQRQWNSATIDRNPPLETVLGR